MSQDFPRPHANGLFAKMVQTESLLGCEDAQPAEFPVSTDARQAELAKIAYNRQSNSQENMFGKIRGRFDEEAARISIDETIKRIAWGFASLSEADKGRAMVYFNTLHEGERHAPGTKYAIRNVG